MDNPADKETFLRLIQDNKGIIWKICNAYCPDPHHREDLAQEIIYQLWKSASQFNSKYKFSTWMYQVALNVAISYYRKHTKGNSVVALSNDHLNMTDYTDGVLLETENVNRLQQFINELKELDRALIILYLEEKSYTEIAAILGISETNVGTKLNRIKERLKQKFENNQ